MLTEEYPNPEEADRWKKYLTMDKMSSDESDTENPEGPFLTRPLQNEPHSVKECKQFLDDAYYKVNDLHHRQQPKQCIIGTVSSRRVSFT